MATIRLQNFGPIKDTGVVELSSVLLVIGRQSAGKSAFMKVLCYCRWLEKHIMTSFKELIPFYTHNQRFMKDLMQFHRMDELYFTTDTRIDYDGDMLYITFPGNNMNAKIVRKDDVWEKRFNTKLCYLPAERNLVSAVRSVVESYKTTDRDVLFNFIMEWREMREPYGAQHPIPLSLTDDFMFYKENNVDVIVLPNGKPISSYYASSGVQSVLPIDVARDYLSSLVGKSAPYSQSDLLNAMMEMLGEDSKLDEKEFAEAWNRMKNKMSYQSMQLFVEEPEQNLYPDAQKKLVLNLIRTLKKANSIGAQRSSLVLTTHSPYVLSVLNVLIAEAAAKQQRPDDERIARLVDESTLLPLSEYAAYFIDGGGVFRNIKDAEIPMFSGIELDEVSDWVNEKVGELNMVLYGSEEGE